MELKNNFWSVELFDCPFPLISTYLYHCSIIFVMKHSFNELKSCIGCLFSHQVQSINDALNLFTTTKVVFFLSTLHLLTPC